MFIETMRARWKPGGTLNITALKSFRFNGEEVIAAIDDLEKRLPVFLSGLDQLSPLEKLAVRMLTSED